MLMNVIKKELKRVFSDRRLVFSSFIMPAVMIFVLYSFMGSMLSNQKSDVEEHQTNVYVQNAPEGFEQFADNQDLNINIDYIGPGDDIATIKEDIKIGDVDLLVQFEEGFLDKVKGYDQFDAPPQVKTFYNPTEDYSQKGRSTFVSTILSNYQRDLLAERFGNESYAVAFDIDRNKAESIVVDEQKASGQGISNILPMLIAIILFSGAMGIGIDTIAGEKERGTMSTLLLTPAKRETIALGKIIGLGIVAIISATTSFIAILASLPSSSNVLTGESSMNLGAIQFTPLQMVQLLVIMLTLVAIFVGLISLISVRARTVKEAGTYIAPVYMVVMIAAFSTLFGSGADELYQFAIPIYGSVSAIKASLAFDLTMNQFLVSALSALITSLILIKLITMTFNDEKVMLNA
ncbi:ABC transporter permease [Vallitalea pronyensis]|uniref:ABC transporter permease n=1 Tax=Vallitalea pronyensis TaxID=1348613 RepID=A0A8J8MGH7_9FIRM|nr:ABC transporter permease [Vallitalea pronyensis]QUI21362.1 ABC transporter permease [Vallitalea pronyensis]